MALAFAALVKLVPLLAVPLLLRRWRWVGALAFGAGIVALAAPYARSGAGALAGLGTEAGASVFNDSLHYLLVRVVGATATGLLSALALAAAAVALAVWGGRGADGPARGVAFLFGMALLLNAVVEPWYLAWMLPFVALFLGERGPRAEGRGPGGERRSLAPRPSSFAPTPLLGWLWLSGAVQLTDLTYLGSGAARWWPLIRAVEYGPLFALLAWDGLRQLRLRLARRAAPGTSGS